MDKIVAIIGGGLAGVTTLYELTARNVPAVLFEEGHDVAGQTSFANGSILSASAPDPWNGPGIGRNLLASLIHADAAMKLHFHALPSLIGWGIRFVRHSTASRHLQSTIANYALAAASIARTIELIDSLGIEMCRGIGGSMRSFTTEAAMTDRIALLNKLAPFGFRFERLDRAATIEREPLLESSAKRLYGSLYFPDDLVGDARAFTQQLADAARRNGATIRLQSRVERVVPNGNRFDLHVGTEVIPAQRVVIAAGNASARIARSSGIVLPIRPVKGYSLTYDAADISEKPINAVVDEALHAVVVPLGEQIRVVAAADFAGNDASISAVRSGQLRDALRTLYPVLAERLDNRIPLAWAGFRPMSVDGRPFIGGAGVPGLWINAGHGPLGWTMAAGSAALLADLMEGAMTRLDARPFSPSR